MKAIEIGGTADHVHLLSSLPSTLAIAKAMQLLKGGSSKWVHETFRERCIRLVITGLGPNDFSSA